MQSLSVVFYIHPTRVITPTKIAYTRVYVQNLCSHSQNAHSLVNLTRYNAFLERTLFYVSSGQLYHNYGGSVFLWSSRNGHIGISFPVLLCHALELNKEFPVSLLAKQTVCILRWWMAPEQRLGKWSDQQTSRKWCLQLRRGLVELQFNL